VLPTSPGDALTGRDLSGEHVPVSDEVHMSAHDSAHRSRCARAIGVIAGCGFSVFIYLMTQLSMLIRPGWGWSSFRAFFQGDQLTLFAAVVNGSQGRFASVEPFTETGHFSDPHLYLTALGFISYITHAPPAAVWNFVGVSLQVILVVGVGLGAVLVSRRWWAACLGALPFLVGTLSFHGIVWYQPLKSHGLLWSPFATMFPLNSTAAALVLISLLFLMLFAAVRHGDRRLGATGVLVGAGVGLLANVDTYSFFTALFFAIYGLSAYHLAVDRRLWPIALSATLFPVVFLVGPSFANSIGRLNTLPIGLLPALPGFCMALAKWRWRIVAPFLALAAAAAPQLISVSEALHAGDPFLNFRQTVTARLGVDWKHGLACALPLLVPLVMILIAGVVRRRAFWVAYAGGSIAAWFFLTTNDAWGTNQEPYQFWIDSYALIAFTIIPVALEVCSLHLSPRLARQNRVPPRWRVLVASLAVITVGLMGASSIDWFRFYRSLEGQTFTYTGPVYDAMKTVAHQVTNNQLIFTDLCVGPTTFKATTGARVAFFGDGLAWPNRHNQINAVWVSAIKGDLKASQLAAAGIGWMVTDSVCTEDWSKTYGKYFIRTASAQYDDTPQEAIVLWKFRTD